MEHQQARFRDFVHSFGDYWFAYMSGGPSVPAAILALYVENGAAKILLWLTAIGCAGLSAYFVWRVERQKVIDMTEKITPKFKVLFDKERGGIASEVDKTEIQLPGTYGGTRVTAGPAFNVSYLRICVTATSHVSVKNCQAFVLSVEKQTNPSETFIQINLPHPMPLENEPFEVMPHIPRMVDFMKASEQDNKFIKTGYWSNALADAFSDKATYRFTIAVNGDGITAKPVKVDVVWRGDWDRISAHQVQET